MQAEVVEWAYGKGWEPDPDRSFADECALLHSEVSEALEAYRTWRFDDATEEAAPRDEFTGELCYDNPQKPQGVGSELADVLVRIMHYSGMRGYTINLNVSVPDKMKSKCTSFGSEITAMHGIVSTAAVCYDLSMYHCVEDMLSLLLAMLLYSCELHGLDLEWEYRRKMDYNLTRSYRHGNKVM